MRRSVKDYVKGLAIATIEHTNSLTTTPVTDSTELRALIQSLRPISPGVKLIRLGPTGDGGYLVPDDLAGIAACFSPGVGELSGFEEDCAKLGMQVFLADKSVDCPTAGHDGFSFTQKYIGAKTNDDFMTLDEWVGSSLEESQSDLLLEMDIEGYEYETLLNVSNRLLGRFRIIVVEFHSLDMLWCQAFFRLAASAFQKILETHLCVHLHPNNFLGSSTKRGLEIPELMEFTFLRRDRINDWSHAGVFPHPLDIDNTGNPTLTLPECWHA